MSVPNDTWETYSFDSAETIRYLGELVAILTKMGVDITVKEQLKAGFEKLFHIEYVNMPDLSGRNYIIASNHISDFDALIMGLIHDRIKIMAKNAWVQSKELMRFLSPHYDLIGIDRDSKINQARTLVEMIRYLSDRSEVHHALIFPQGTISDINKNNVERIQSGVFAMSERSETPILPVYIEQPNFHHPSRIVFGELMDIPGRKQDCRALWRDELLSLQNSLNPPARVPALTEKHANNNKPGDPFF